MKRLTYNNVCATLALVTTLAVGALFAPVASARPTQRARIHALETQVRHLKARLASFEARLDQVELAANSANDLVDALNGCLSAGPAGTNYAMGVDTTFQLTADRDTVFPVIAQLPVIVTAGPEASDWLAYIDAPCVEGYTASRARGLRIARLGR